MRLILMRNAEAEARKEGQDDSRRPLTKAGMDALNQYIPDFTSYLEAHEDVELWSSGYTRAIQTMGFLQQSRHVRKVETHKFVHNGNLKKLKEALKNTEAQTLVIVGHGLYLSIWTKALTGKMVPFNTLETALIDYNPEEEKGHLIWTWRLNEEVKLEPYSDDFYMTAKDWLEELFHKYHQQILNSRYDFIMYTKTKLLKPNDDRDTRNMQMLLRTFKPLMSSSEYNKASERYGITQKQILSLIELDQLIREFEEEGDSEKYPHLLKELHREHKTERKMVKKNIFSSETRKLYRKAFRNIIKGLRKNSETLETRQDLVEFLENRRDALEERLDHMLEYFTLEDYDRLEEICHLARILIHYDEMCEKNQMKEWDESTHNIYSKEALILEVRRRLHTVDVLSFMEEKSLLPEVQVEATEALKDKRELLNEKSKMLEQQINRWMEIEE